MQTHRYKLPHIWVPQISHLVHTVLRAHSPVHSLSRFQGSQGGALSIAVDPEAPCAVPAASRGSLNMCRFIEKEKKKTQVINSWKNFFPPFLEQRLEEGVKSSDKLARK